MIIKKRKRPARSNTDQDADAWYHLISHTKHRACMRTLPITVGTVANYQEKLPFPRTAPKRPSIPQAQGLAPTAPSLCAAKDLLLFVIAFRKVYHRFANLSTPLFKIFLCKRNKKAKKMICSIKNQKYFSKSY